MDRKTYHAPLGFKAGQAGEFEAIFATFGVKDLDGDVTLPGAFTQGAPVVIEGWNHDYRLPVGQGTIYADTMKAWVLGQFMLDTQAGREHYQIVKALGPAVEWSYTFTIVDARTDTFAGELVRILKKLDVWGVSPVTRGAGIGTHTQAIKGAGGNDAALRGQLYALLAGEQIDVELTSLLKQQVADLENELLKEGSPALVSVAIGAMGGRKGAPTRADRFVSDLVSAEFSERYALACLQMKADDIAARIHERQPWLLQEQCKAAAWQWLRAPA